MMKTGIIFLLIIFLFQGFTDQTRVANTRFNELSGSWELMSRNGDVVSERRIRIITQSYFSEAGFDPIAKAFNGASAGVFTRTGAGTEETFLANTWNSELVGISESFEITIAGNTLRKTGRKNGKRWTETWKKIGAEPGYPLSGAWRISGRIQNGEWVEMPDRPRKTLKILSENRFQWIALNSETKEFFGTGGGTYEVSGDKYTENIEFFSRDSSRVGMSLTFDLEITDQGWHHSGKGSTGNPVDEIWINIDAEY